MNLADAFAAYLPRIEAEMRAVVTVPAGPAAGHYEIMQYHMGWRDETMAPAQAPTGKRIRPMLCVLACLAADGAVEQALPAAAGLELLHNFSLIHDDIEDNSATRRHRKTAWVLFGMPIACNAGDGMFSLAHMAFLRLPGAGVSAEITLHALKVFERTCLAITEGQYQDMSFERRDDVTVEDYYAMIAGKTGALLASAPEIGALVAGATPAVAAAYRDYGAALGRAFQMQDDILGIWGDESATGKSAASDILSKKKSLPVLHAFAHPEVGKRLRACYAGAVTPADVPAILALLDAAGARAAAEQAVTAATAAAHAALDRVRGAGSAPHQALLRELLDSLVGRQA